MIPKAAPLRTVLLAGAVTAISGGCGGKAQAPVPGTSQGSPPDLRGSRVMVLPVQRVVGVEGDANAELAFGLRGRGAGVTWILPPRLDEVLERSPGLDTRTRGLAVGGFSSRQTIN